MARQDQTLANTMAKIGMEAKRRQNAEATSLSMQPGIRQLGDLPWWAHDRALNRASPSFSAAEVELRGLGGMLLGPMSERRKADILQIWQKEGLDGIKRLVAAGVLPPEVLTQFPQGSPHEQTPGGLTGGPVGSGLPEPGV